MWHSQLGPEFLDEIYRDRRYHKVIAHRNYNPRLVSFVLDSDKVSAQPTEEYWNYVLGTLNDPQDVWGHFFDNQMGQDARDLVFLTVLNGGQIGEGQLRESFLDLHTHSEPNQGLLDHRFRTASRHCVGSVLDRVLSNRGRAVYSLFNPSIADFIQRRLAVSDLWDYYYKALRTPESLAVIRQIRSEPFFGEDRFTRVVAALGDLEVVRTGPPSEYSLLLARIIGGEEHLRERYRSIVTDWLYNPRASVVETQPGHYIALFNQSREFLGTQEFLAAAQQLPTTLDDIPLPTDEPELLKDLLESLDAVGEYETLHALRARIIEDWANQITDVVRSEGVLADFYDRKEESAATAALTDAINDWLWECGVDLAGPELQRLVGMVDVDSVIESNRERAYHEPDDESGFRGEGPSAIDEVDDLFDRSGQF